MTGFGRLSILLTLCNGALTTTADAKHAVALGAVPSLIFLTRNSTAANDATHAASPEVRPNDALRYPRPAAGSSGEPTPRCCMAMRRSSMRRRSISAG